MRKLIQSNFTYYSIKISLIYGTRTHARIAAGAALAIAVVVVLVVPAASDVHHVANGASLARGRVGRAAAGLLASAMLVGAA